MRYVAALMLFMLSACVPVADTQFDSPLVPQLTLSEGVLAVPPSHQVTRELHQQESPLYLPNIHNRQTTCGHNVGGQRLADAFLSHPEQQRENPKCHPLLVKVASARARDMAERLYFSHCNPEGTCPNDVVLDTGYPLPYGRGANNVESIAASFGTPEEAFAALTKSPGHRSHVLGTIDFFRAQDCFGMGYASRARLLEMDGVNYGQWYVVITAPCP